MELGIQVRPTVEQDAPAMARVHVESWRETYWAEDGVNEIRMVRR